jgi:hypothetical protein
MKILQVASLFKDENDEGTLESYLEYYMFTRQDKEFYFDQFIELSHSISQGRVPFLKYKNDEILKEKIGELLKKLK